MLDGILEITKEKDILTVYAKNLFGNYKNLEIVTLTNKNKIIQSKLILSENKIKVFIFDLDQIEFISLKIPVKEESVQSELEIVLNNGKKIYLNSNIDTDTHLKERYSNYIKEIARYLTVKEHL
jgi:antitoxin component YwqK of YwqJK toxin-antitoxin module